MATFMKVCTKMTKNMDLGSFYLKTVINMSVTGMEIQLISMENFSMNSKMFKKGSLTIICNMGGVIRNGILTVRTNMKVSGLKVRGLGRGPCR